METKNGYVRWWQLATVSVAILTIVTSIGIAFANQAIAVDVRSMERDKGILEQQNDIRTLIQEYAIRNEQAHSQAIATLARIEAELKEVRRVNKLTT